MRFVYVLEDDAKFQKEIVEAIQNIDSKIQIRIFGKLDQFVSWIKEMMATGPESIAKGGVPPHWLPPQPITEEAHQLVTIISKIEFLGVRQIPLLKKTRDQFIKKNICTKEDPTAFVLTTFDEPTFHIKELRDRILNNVIYKPFDRLILTQHLTNAIDGRHPPSKFTIANQKSSALIEMLKDAKLDAISEFGFISRSDRILEKKGFVTKYYGKSFSGDSKISLMASIFESKPDPTKPEEFICSFAYFALLPEQISAFRKKIKHAKPEQHYAYDWTLGRQDSKRLNRAFGVVIIDEQEQQAKDLAEALKRKFTNIQIAIYKNAVDFTLDLDPKLAESMMDKQTIKALPQGKEITFVFDPLGNQIVDFIKSTKDKVVLFNSPEEDLKTPTFWSKALGAEMLNTWKEWIAKPSNQILVVKHQIHTYYMQLVALEQDKGNKQLKVKMGELTPEQKNEYLKSHSKIPKVTDAVLVSQSYIKTDSSEYWTKIKVLLKERASVAHPNLDSLLFILAAKDYSDVDRRQLSTFVRDIFFKPLDRHYISLKLKLFFPEVSVPKDDVQPNTIAQSEEINIASPVVVSEMSEAGLVMQYYRAISLGAFRGFVLWVPYEVDAPKPIATCNFTEESSQKGEFNHHFVFFGMTDQFLKAIRVWIRENYIHSKEKG